MSNLNLSRLNVVVVDDNVFARKLVEQSLRALGIHEVKTAEDGAEAYSMLKSYYADLAIVDWEMEPINGIDFVKRIRRDENSPNRYLPIIMLTAHAELGRVAEARDAGINEYIIKPFSARTIYKRIEDIVERPRPFVEVKGEYFGPDRRRRNIEFGGTERRGVPKPVQPAEESAAADGNQTLQQEEINEVLSQS